jgi:hypothetical protein
MIQSADSFKKRSDALAAQIEALVRDSYAAGYSDLSSETKARHQMTVDAWSRREMPEASVQIGYAEFLAADERRELDRAKEGEAAIAEFFEAARGEAN